MWFENGFGKNDTPDVKGLKEHDAQEAARKEEQEKGLQGLFKWGYEDARKNRELANQTPANSATGKSPEFSIAPAPDANGLRIEEGFESSVSAVVESWDTKEGTPLTPENQTELTQKLSIIQTNLTKELTEVDARKMSPDEYAKKLLSIQEKYLAELQKVADTAHGLIHGAAAKKDAEMKAGTPQKPLEARKAFDEHMAELIVRREIDLRAAQKRMAAENATRESQEARKAENDLRNGLRDIFGPSTTSERLARN